MVTFYRRLPRFEYLQPKSLDEALSLLKKYKGKAKLIAGGTDLLISMKNRDLAPGYVINLKAIPNLDYIQYGEKGLRIGALARISGVEKSTIIIPCLAMIPTNVTRPIPL